MHKRGFSLVELSIVLVILGLLTGGILTGQSLIRASELRAVTTEYQRYVAAAQTFRDKYFSIPGDMTNATKFWGTATNCPGTTVQPSTTQATCDGNGDGLISAAAPLSNEDFRFWQHLANAGLIEGTYVGVTGAGHATNHAVLGWNAPRSKLTNSGWGTHSHGIHDSAHATFFEGDYQNCLTVGRESTNWVPSNGVFKPEEAWNIDSKLDDGKPAYGRVRVLEGNTTCHTSTTPSTSEYALSATNTDCSLWFPRAF